MRQDPFFFCRTKLVAVIAIAILIGCERPPPRSNVLERHYPGGFHALPAQSKKLAAEFGTRLMGAFDELGVGGLGDVQNLSQLRAQLLVPLEPMAKATAEEAKCLSAATKVLEVMGYAGSNFRDRGKWSDPEMNRLLRIKGETVEVTQLSYGVAELLLDYLELVAPDSVALVRGISGNSKP